MNVFVRGMYCVTVYVRVSIHIVQTLALQHFDYLHLFL